MGIEFLQNSIIPTRTKGYVAIFKKDISEEFTQRKKIIIMVKQNTKNNQLENVLNCKRTVFRAHS
jgi:hypothetical protein